MNLLRYIPNAFTMANILSGCIAVLFAVNDRLDIAALFVAIGIFFDFFDGFFARKFNVASEVGLQLDSLADMITSGLVPGIVMYQLITHALGTPWGKDYFSYMPTLAWLGFAITLASAYRLARFNVDSEQKDRFLGLPTPANALLILSFPLILMYEEYTIAKAILTNPYLLVLITILSCVLLNARLPLFALKFNNFGWAQNMQRYIFLVASLVLLIALRYLAIPIIILLYIVLSLLWKPA